MLLGSIGAFAQIVTPSENSRGEVPKAPSLPKELKKVRKFQFGVSLSPDFDYRTLFINKPNRGANRGLVARDSTERPKFGYTVGVVACYNFNPHVALETGVQYSDKGYQSKWLNVYYPGPRPTPYVTQVKYSYTFHYLDIPLMLNLTAGSSKVRFIGSIGAVANVLLKTDYTHKEKYSDDQVVTTTAKSKNTYTKGNLSIALSPGIDVSLAERLTLRVQPTFRFGVIKIIDASLSGLLWNAGLNVTLLFGA